MNCDIHEDNPVRFYLETYPSNDSLANCYYMCSYKELQILVDSANVVDGELPPCGHTSDEDNVATWPAVVGIEPDDI